MALSSETQDVRDHTGRSFGRIAHELERAEPSWRRSCGGGRRSPGELRAAALDCHHKSGSDVLHPYTADIIIAIAIHLSNPGNT